TWLRQLLCCGYLPGAGRNVSKVSRCLTPIKPGESTRKGFPYGRINLSVIATSEQSFRLNFSWQRGTEFRLNTYSDSIGPARVMGPCPWHLNRSSSAVIERRSAVQKLTTVNAS